MRSLRHIAFGLIGCLLTLMGCQMEEAWNAQGMGYLVIHAIPYAGVTTKSSVPENYNPTQLQVEIRNAANELVKSTDNYEKNWKGTRIDLPAGNYTITASSAGFDGQASGFDIPYYVGTQPVTVTNRQEVQTDVVCRLANVKVSVAFDATFQSAFKSAQVTIASKVSGIAAQVVRMGTTSPAIYLPEGNFTAKVELTNKANQTHSLTREFTDVKARDHFQLNYKVTEQGNASITVEADSKEQLFSFTFNVSKQVVPSLGVKMPNTWSTFAYLEGEVTSFTGTMDPAGMTFEWKRPEETQWTSLPAQQNGQSYTQKLTGLTPGTNYQYRMSYTKGEESYTSEALTFSTETQTTLPNGKLDDWYKNDKTWYAISAADYQSGNRFWDSSNPGSTTGAGALINVNPTTGNSSVVHTPGGQSAQFKSQYLSAMGIGKFAAASLYAGQFMNLVGTSGAKLRFGQPFTARPTQLRGWAQYAGVSIDYKGENQPAGTVNKGDPDLWSAYIALVDLGSADGIYVDNTNMSTFPNYDTDERVVAYGALPDSECGNTTDWKQFTIDLVYRSLTRKPTHIIIVLSSSKHGDYFTGGNGSLLYLDDLELVYGDNPITK